MITELKRFKVRENVDLTEIDGEWVIFNAENCMITKLNELGGFIWRKLQEHKDPASVVASIQNEYDIDKETAEKDFYAFVQHLREIGLLEFETGE